MVLLLKMLSARGGDTSAFHFAEGTTSIAGLSGSRAEPQV